MTSRNSSHNAFTFTFKRMFKQCLPLGIVPGALALIFCIGTAISNLVDLGSITYGGFVEGTMRGNQYFFDIFYVVLVLLSCVFGLIAFNFLTSKKESNVYLSLGISKSKLFWSRYLGAGAALAIAVVSYATLMFITDLMTADMIINSVNIKLFLFQVIYALAVAFCAYSVTVLAFVNAGNVVEGVIFTFLYGIFPTAFTELSEQAYGHLTFGSAYGTEFYNYGSKFYSKNWFLDIFGSFTEYGTREQMTQSGWVKDYVAPNPIGLIFCIVSFILIAVLASIMFKKRTSEISGTVFKSFNNYRIVAVLASVLAFCGMTGAEISSRYLLADLSIVVAILVFIVISLVLVRKISVKTAVPLAVAMAVFCIVCFAGYGDSLPSTKEIESVNVILNAEQSEYAQGFSSSDRTMASSFKPLTGSDACFTLTSENDIEWITDIHKNIVEDGYIGKLDDNTANADLMICYKLKDGSYVSRAYSYESTQVYKKMLGFMKTDVGTTYLEQVFDSSIVTSIIEEGDSVGYLPTTSSQKLFGLFYTYNYVNSADKVSQMCGILDSDNHVFVGFNDKNNLYIGNREIDFKNDSSLRDALYKDLKNQTVEQKYFHASSDEVGMLTIIDNESAIADAYEALSYYKSHDDKDEYGERYDSRWSTAFGSIEPQYHEVYNPETEEYDYIEDENYIYPIYRESYKKNRDKAIEQFFAYGFSTDEFLYYNQYKVVVTKDMVNTVKWLKDNGLYTEKANDTSKIVKVRGVKMINHKVQGFAYQTTFLSGATNDFNSSVEYMADCGNEMYFGNSEYITDKATIQSLLDNSRLCAAKLSDNFIVEFIYEDGTHVSKYVSKYNVSDEVEAKFGVKQKNTGTTVEIYDDRVTYTAQTVTGVTGVY